MTSTVASKAGEKRVERFLGCSYTSVRHEYLTLYYRPAEQIGRVVVQSEEPSRALTFNVLGSDLPLRPTMPSIGELAPNLFGKYKAPTSSTADHRKSSFRPNTHSNCLYDIS